MDRLMSVQEAAAILGFHERTVRRMIERDEIRAYKIGRSVRLKSEDVQDYIDSGVIIHTRSIPVAKFSYKPGDKLV